MESNPENKLALVTGGIGGIGTAVCRRMAQDGNRVVAAYHPAEAEAATAWREDRQAEGLDIAVVACDVANYGAGKAMIEEVTTHHGAISILVNCAGITRDKTLRKMDPELWDAVLRTNLDSVFNVTRHAIDGMIEQNFGRIISISSVNGQKGQFGQTNYSASKAGIHGFTMALAQELAGYGITVNSVAPGYIDTDMTRAIPAPLREEMVADIPVGRMGAPEDIANAIAFLASEQAAYITGVNLPVNGGIYMS